MKCCTFILALVICITSVCYAGPEDWDDRFGIVATDSSGWGTDLVPMQGPQFFEPLRAPWWYNYVSSNIETKHWPGYNRLFMFWRAVLSTSDTNLQQIAQDAKALYPNTTVWYAMSNEPNDLGQANQTPQEFAEIYYKHHRNLKIGDPTCKIMGPGLLNWTFQSTSAWKTGKDWYEEFREAWTSNETFRNYSLQNYGTPYPPQDAFNLHTYDLRGVQGTPYEPQSWKYSRDQVLLCYSDLQTYPETAGKKIWLTEFGGLRSPSKTENAGLASAFVLWMKEQSFIDRWFWFINYSDQYGTWRPLELLASDGTPSPLGMAHRDLSLMGADDAFYHIPYHAEHDSGTSYTRPGCSSSTEFAEDTSISLKYYLQNGHTYTANSMRGRTYTPIRGKVKRVTFNYTVNYDNSYFYLAMDVPGTPDKWKLDEFGYKEGYADVDLSASPADSVSFAFVSKQNLTYLRPSGEWWVSVSNITMYLYLPPTTPEVDDHCAFTTSTSSLNASWSAEAPSEPISEYWYAIGTTPGGTDVKAWTNVGLDTSVTVDGLSLTTQSTYYFAVKAKSSDNQWSDVGTSDGITVVEATGTPGELKSNPNTTYVGFSGVVTANADSFTRTAFVESPDRSGAIRVYLGYAPSPAVGSMVDVAGTLAEVGGERYIANSTITVTGTAPEPMEPITMLNRNVGGESLNPLTGGVTHGVGTNNIAMLVQTAGRVSRVDTGIKVFYIDDGSAIPADIGTGLAVGYSVATGSITPPSVGDYVIVTGVSGIRGSGGILYPIIKLRSQGDLAIL